MIKSFLSFMLFFSPVLVLATAGCTQEDSAGHPLEVLSSDRQEASATFPLTVTDRMDRQVTIASAAKRIVSLTPSMTEMIYAIGAQDRLVGVTAFCNYPPEAQDKPRVGGGTNESISRERLLDLEPDLVLCKWDSHEPLVTQLDGWNIVSVGLGAESFEGMYEELLLLGQITEREEAARKLVETLTARVEEIVSRVAQEPERPRVFYQVWDDPLMSAGPESFIGKVLSMAGTENILADTNIRYPKISSEVVIDADPELIIAPTSHSEPVTVESILQREGWQQIEAIRNKRVFLIDGDRISRCAPRLVDELEEIVNVVHGSAPTGKETP